MAVGQGGEREKKGKETGRKKRRLEAANSREVCRSEKLAAGGSWRAFGAGVFRSVGGQRSNDVMSRHGALGG